MESKSRFLLDDILIEVDLIILTLGQPIESGSKTNALFVHIVGGEKSVKLENSQLPLRCQALPEI